MTSNNRMPESRFGYTTNLYAETISFYKNIMQLEIYNSCDRVPNDKGTIFKSPNGVGLLEIEEGEKVPVITGSSLYIEVENIEQLYEMAVKQAVRIIQPIQNTSFGHRNFKFEDPNKLIIGLFEYLTLD